MRNAIREIDRRPRPAGSKLKTTCLALESTGLTASSARRLLAADGPCVVFEKRDNRNNRDLYSILALDPLITLEVRGTQATLKDCASGQTIEKEAACPFSFIQEQLNDIESRVDTESLPAAVRFAAGFVGYLGYGLVRQMESIGRNRRDPFGIPEARLFFPGAIVYLDHQTDTAHVISHRGLRHARSIRSQLLGPMGRVASPDQTADLLRHTGAPLKAALDTPIDLEPTMTRESFLSKVESARRSIEQGDAFQIVLSQRLTTRAPITASQLFDTLAVATPSAYRYLLDFEDFQYVGSSPEKLVSVEGDAVSICALAGTRPRGRSRKEDERQERSLTSCQKERAEHLMLVDLGRNDLGKICQPGSIEVGPIAQVAKYSNVMHLATELSGTLAPGVEPADAIRACFPRGTVSGAPKVRAMQLLAELEPEERGIYSGAVGFLDIRNNVETAIAIRSALFQEGTISINAGAGIVYDSVAEHEYQETINKAAAITRAIAVFRSLADNRQDDSRRELLA